MELISSIIGEVPPELNKWRHYYRGTKEYSKIFPKLSKEQLLDLVTKVNETRPGSIQRKQVINQYFILNQKQE